MTPIMYICVGVMIGSTITALGIFLLLLSGKHKTGE